MHDKIFSNHIKGCHPVIYGNKDETRDRHVKWNDIESRAYDLIEEYRKKLSPINRD